MSDSVFWSPQNISLSDPLNSEIWSRSPSVQESIHSAATLQAPGAIGAQQAMVTEQELRAFGYEGSSLPWVPDILGKGWAAPESIFIVGSAYAGFIQEYSSRQNTLTLESYATCKSGDRFLELFIKNVAADDRNYYAPLQHLIEQSTSPSNFALFDLCRASFVCRGGSSHVRRDISSDAIVKREPEIFTRYCESDGPRDWTWRRLIASQASRIVALGTIAEHGLLRLFQAKGMSVNRRQDVQVMPPLTSPKWVGKYADERFHISYWVDNDDSWVVHGKVGSSERNWYLLPIYHPSVASSRLKHYDPDYRRAAELLSALKFPKPT